MVVAVQRPRRERSDLDTVLKGLQVVGGVLNIKDQLGAAERLKAQQERQAQIDTRAQESHALQMTAAERALGLSQKEEAIKERQAKGVFTPLERAEKGFVQAPKGFAGAIPLTEPMQPGLAGPAEGGMFVTARQAGLLEKQKQAQLAAEESRRKLAEEQTKTEIQREKTLRTEFANKLEMKEDAPIRQIRKAGKITSLYNKEKVGTADDVAAINLYARLLSPGIVTTTDFENVKKVGGYDQKARAFVDSVAGQGELTPTQRYELINAIKSMTSESIEEYKLLQTEYTALANEQKVDVEDVVTPERGIFIDRTQQNIDATIDRLGKAAGIIQQPTIGGPGEAIAAPAQPTKEQLLRQHIQNLRNQQGRR